MTSRKGKTTLSESTSVVARVPVISLNSVTGETSKSDLSGMMGMSYLDYSSGYKTAYICQALLL